MNDEPCRFVDHDDVGVLVDYPKRDRLRTGPRRLRRRHVSLDERTGIDAVAGIADRMAVDFDAAGLD